MLFRSEAIDALLEYQWPGNVRELANVMERAYILAGGGLITPEHLPYHMLHAEPATISFPISDAAMPSIAPLQPKTLKEVEKEHILRVLDKHQGNKVTAAGELGIVLKTLYNKLNQWQEEDQQQRHAG